MKYYITAGEASGDLHGANLMSGILKNDPDAQFRFWGGDRMAAVGGGENLARHYRTASFFGAGGVLLNMGTIYRQLRECRRDIAGFRPDAVILIDYPGFNFRIARFAHKRGFRTFWYISPKVWAWKESRIKLIRKYVDKLFVIFPFEKEYFGVRGIEAIYEGNPLVDEVEKQRAAAPSRGEFLRINGIPDDKPLVALLAGSRRSEIRHNLPFMIELSRRFPDHRFVIAGVGWLPRELYDEITGSNDVSFVSDQTCAALIHSEAAVVTSGTATLETALVGTPELVCYKGDRLTMTIGRMILTIRFISLVNLIMDREVVRELIHWDMTMPKAETELRAILRGGGKRERMLDDFAALRDVIGGTGASERFAKRMVEILRTGGPSGQ